MPEEYPFDRWSACELYGHVFQTDGRVRYCPYCGESYLEELEPEEN